MAVSPVAAGQNLAQLLFLQNQQMQAQRQQDLYGDRTAQYNATTGARGLQGGSPSPILLAALAQQNRGRVDPRQLAQAMGANIPGGSNGGVGSGSGTASGNTSALQLLAAQLAGQKEMKILDRDIQGVAQDKNIAAQKDLANINIAGQKDLQNLKVAGQKDLAITDSNLTQQRKREDRQAALAAFNSGGKRIA